MSEFLDGCQWCGDKTKALNGHGLCSDCHERLSHGKCDMCHLEANDLIAFICGECRERLNNEPIEQAGECAFCGAEKEDTSADFCNECTEQLGVSKATDDTIGLCNNCEELRGDIANGVCGKCRWLTAWLEENGGASIEQQAGQCDYCESTHGVSDGICTECYQSLTFWDSPFNLDTPSDPNAQQLESRQAFFDFMVLANIDTMVQFWRLKLGSQADDKDLQAALEAMAVFIAKRGGYGAYDSPAATAAADYVESLFRADDSENEQQQ